MAKGGSEVYTLWTLKVVGNTPFHATLTGNPTLAHAGGLSVINLMATKGQIQSIVAEATAIGCEVQVWPMAGQTDQQTQLRKDRLKVMDVADVPCVECQECAWFDPWEEEVCGFAGLPPESKKQLLLTSPPHRESLLKCPIT